MRTRTAQWTASAALASAVGCASAALVLGVRHVDVFFQDWGVLLVVFLAFAAVGWVVATRRPGNPVGWLLLLFGCLPLALSLVQTYAELELARRPESPLGAVLAWLGELPWLGIWSVFALVLMLFPTGRPASPAWRWVVRAVVANAVASTLVAAVAVWPVRADLVGPERLDPSGLWGGFMVLLSAGVAASMVAGAASLVVRYRASGEEQRAQLKWIAYAGLLVIGSVAIVVVRNVAGEVPAIFEWASLVGLAGVPVAMGVAILRYRLYDIDRLASRTVTYALLSGLLAVAYVAAAMLFGRLLAPLGAGGDVAVAAATLSAAALFSPARRRIQAAVDRHFNRARYDAEREVERFRYRLRDEVDLDEIAAALQDAAWRTVQPAVLVCWLRDPEAGR